ncbi:MAG: PIN domain-containing protein [Acidobacteriaceae bacterium]
MSYLIDTNVLSELSRRQPEPRVVTWFSNRPASGLFISVLTLGEIRKGIEGVTDAARRLRLNDWLEAELPAFFYGRMLPVDGAVAERWGRLLGAAGRPVAAIDSLLAATALHYELQMVTRNRADFAFPGLNVIDPWQE